MANQLFKEKLLNDKFFEEGFIYYNKKRIDKELINTILEKFKHSSLYLPDYNKQLHTIDTKEKEELKQFSHFIEKELDIIFKEIFNDIEFVFSMIVSKASNSKDILHLHQDASFIDEEDKESIGITFWIPLVDVNLQNGCMGLIKKSHRIYDAVCPLPFPDVYTPLWKHSFALMPYCSFIEMKAGEILIFNSKVFHGGLPNFSDTSRYALSVWLTNKKDNNYLYFLKPGTTDTLLKYKVDKEFYFKYDNTRLHDMYSNGQKLTDYAVDSEIEYIYKDYSADKIIQEVMKSDNHFDQSIKDIISKYYYNELNPGVFSKIFTKIKQLFK